MLKIEFTNNITNYISANSSLYSVNLGRIEFSDSQKSSAYITKIKNTIFVESINLSSNEKIALFEALNIIFNTGYNSSKKAFVIECKTDEFYNIDKGQKYFCNIKFTFDGALKYRNFDVLITE